MYVCVCVYLRSVTTVQLKMHNCQAATIVIICNEQYHSCMRYRYILLWIQMQIECMPHKPTHTHINTHTKLCAVVASFGQISTSSTDTKGFYCLASTTHSHTYSLSGIHSPLNILTHIQTHTRIYLHWHPQLHCALSGSHLSRLIAANKNVLHKT